METTPRVIHRQWFGPREMPDRYQENAQLWKTLNPDWELIDHTYDTLPPLRNQQEFDKCGKTWAPARGDAKEASLIQVTQADIAAYEILWNHGGLYVNCDMRPVQPLPSDFTERDLTLAYEIDGALISNAFMASAPRHPLMDAIIEGLPHNIRTCKLGVDYVTGPRFLTRLTEAHAPDAFILPARACNPTLPPSPQVIYPETICVHEWGHATNDEHLWPQQGRQSGAQRYF